MGRGKHKGRHISLSRGRGKLGHNNRDFLSPNVDKARVKDNIVIRQQDLGVAYEKVFGDARKAYNDKQTRKSRQIDDYYVKLFGKPTDEIVKGGNAGKQQNFFEYVIGIGNKDDTGFATNPEMAAVAVECLKEYYYGNEEHGVKSFEERNPNFYLFNAVIHCDEATPHGHHDIIPFADGYKSGMTRQQGIAKALEQMGYGKGKNAIKDWTKTERQVFREICERHGIEVAEEQKGRGVTLTTEQYREYAELKSQNTELQSRNKDLNKQNDALEYQNDMLGRINDLAKQQLTQDVETLNAVKEEIETKLETVKDIDKQILAAVEIPPRPVEPVEPPRIPSPPMKYQVYSKAEEREYNESRKVYDRVVKQRNNDLKQYQQEYSDWEKKAAEWDKMYAPIIAVKKQSERIAIKERELATKERAMKEQIAAMQEQSTAQTERMYALENENVTLKLKIHECFQSMAIAIAIRARTLLEKTLSVMGLQLSSGYTIEEQSRNAEHRFSLEYLRKGR